MDPQNPYAAPQSDLSPPPGAEWLEGVSPSLRRTGIGLSLVYFGIVIALLSAMIFVGSVYVFSRDPQTRVILIGAAGVGFLIGAVLMFIGPFVCLAVPAESRAAPMLVGSILFQLPLVVNAVIQPLAPDLVARELRVVLLLSGIVGFVLFVLFLKNLARYIGREDYCSRARRVLWGYGIVIVLIVIWIGALATQNFILGGLASISFLLGGLLVLVMYANLVNDLRKALAGK